MVLHMRRSACWVFCLAVPLAWAAPVAHGQEVHPIVQLARKMAKPVDFPALENGISLREVLELLSKKSGVHFDVNERAFEMENVGGAALAPNEGNFDIRLVVAQD